MSRWGERNGPVCSCHGEPAYWQKDARKPSGGWWECAVKRRQIQRDRYDNDPIHRITKWEKDVRRRRLATLTRRREALRGQVQDEG